MFAADDFATIAARRREIRKDRGLPDDNWRTAEGTELDNIAAFYGVNRTAYEADSVFRDRIEAELRRRNAFL